MPDLGHLSTLSGFSVDTLALLIAHEALAIFVGTFLFGEIWILTAFFLAGVGIWSFGEVFTVAILGSLFADLFWYVVTPFIFRGRLKPWLLARIDDHLPLLLKRHIEENLFWTMLFIKFAVGLRLMFTMFLSMKRTPFPIYLRNNLLGTGLFVGTLSIAGYLTGKGVYNFFPFFHGIEYIIPAIILLVIVFRLAERYIAKRLL